ncbi:RICIN domain-containing protein [Burkholderia sp. BKH01]|uniref:RICIN domain-containing protein n=1 Tax=Burkholderia sp. BKH01 TaxID=2769262 RepID=UPI0021DF8D38|nr:RICIN domain-containing protein [Burkholderia sp. BKH01]MCU9951926.1 RICIN domain-containing protein [Burkholderia sp. BKH01]
MTPLQVARSLDVLTNAIEVAVARAEKTCKRIPMRTHALLLSVFMLSACGMDSPEDVKPLTTNSSHSAHAAKAADTDWQLIFSEDFKDKKYDGGFNPSKWSYCKRNTKKPGSDWDTTITNTPAYASQTGGRLVLRLDDAVIADDPIAYHSGCVTTADKLEFTYGKVEVRAKFNQGDGSWPAIWMLPEDGDWPDDGEIDIMEHLKFNPVVYGNAIMSPTEKGEESYTSSGNGLYNVDDFNTYGLEWSPTELKFYVNGSLYHTYSKPVNATRREWPFDKPFYIILNQSGGSEGDGYAEKINNSHLPFHMEVDSVKVYQRPEFESGATYKIFSALDNTSVLGVNGAGNDTSVVLRPDNTPSVLDQQWRLTSTGDGYYLLQPMHALSKSFNVTGIGNESKVQIQDDNGSKAQRWQIKNVGNGYYVLAPASDPSKRLEVAGGSTVDGTSIQINDHKADNAQKFRIVKQ